MNEIQVHYSLSVRILKLWHFRMGRVAVFISPIPYVSQRATFTHSRHTYTQASVHTQANAWKFSPCMTLVGMKLLPKESESTLMLPISHMPAKLLLWGGFKMHWYHLTHQNVCNILSRVNCFVNWDFLVSDMSRLDFCFSPCLAIELNQPPSGSFSSNTSFRERLRQLFGNAVWRPEFYILIRRHRSWR